MEKLLNLIYEYDSKTWSEKADEAFKELFGSETGRYPDRAKNAIQIRAPRMSDESNIPFATLIEQSNPKSGAYGGMSVGLFPVEGKPCLIALGTGTAGLHPDAAILAKPGHARKGLAICEAINRREKRLAAWAKHDPSRNDLPVPQSMVAHFSNAATFKKYSKELYVIYQPTEDREATSFALKALLDLYFEERGFAPLSAYEPEFETIRSEYFKCLMPDTTEAIVTSLLNERRFVVLEGPPGTGKTRMALRLKQNQYGNEGASIQFHPNSTYESFIGGLAPSATNGGLGFRFEPAMGELMRAAAAAKKIDPKPFLLHIDEINRADLSKILGEAVFLLEYSDDIEREILLPYDFDDPFHNKLSLPTNLHILGTMNSADRSIAIVDVAIRRRFAFVKLWPQLHVIESSGSRLAEDAFKKLLSIFTEYASEDAFSLMPGHSYFLSRDGTEAAVLRSLRVNLLPLLEEYLAQGYVTGFADHIRAYSQWVNSITPSSN